MKKVLIALLLCVCLLPVQVFAQSSNAIAEAALKPVPQKGILSYSLSSQAADEAAEEILSMYAPYVLGGNYKCTLNYEIFGEKKMKIDTVTTYFYNETENEERMWVDYDAENSKLLLIYFVNGQYSYVDMGVTESGRTTLENFENMSVYNPKRIYKTMQKLSSLLSNPEYKDGVYTQSLAEEEYQSFLKELSYEMVCLANGVTLYDGEAEQLKNEITEYYDVLLKDVRQLDSNEGIELETVLDKNNNIQSSSCTLNIDLDSKKFVEAIGYEALNELSDAKGAVKLAVDYKTFEGEVPFPELTEENSVDLNAEESSSSYYTRGWNIVLEGNRLGMKNAPIVENDRALASGQELCDALGAEYTYENGVLTVNNGAMVFTAGSDKCLVNGVENALEVTPKEMDYELFVPVRFLAEQLGYRVGFKQELSAGGESVYASIVLIDPEKIKMQLMLPESQSQQRQVAELAATITDVELTLIDALAEHYTEKSALILAAGEPVMLYETEAYDIFRDKGEFVYDLTPFIETVAPETLQWINENEEIKKSVTDENGAIIAFPVQCGETVERFYVPESVATPLQAVQFLQTYSMLVGELIVK
ncbi:MAG: hypothetical protein E7403_07215 [Ruminococcaceae bacterium]|nr:hypothetical protein [Oscillospiraceae bacterium]